MAPRKMSRARVEKTDTQAIMDSNDWNAEQDAAIETMTTDEILQAMEDLSRYDKFTTLVSTALDSPMTPRQMQAFTAFALTLGDDLVIDDGAIKRATSFEKQVLTVVDRRVAEINRYRTLLGKPVDGLTSYEQDSLTSLRSRLYHLGVAEDAPGDIARYDVLVARAQTDEGLTDEEDAEMAALADLPAVQVHISDLMTRAES